MSNRWNKNQAETLGALIIRNDDIDELLEEILKKDKLYTEFGIEHGIDYSVHTNRDRLYSNRD